MALSHLKILEDKWLSPPRFCDFGHPMENEDECQECARWKSEDQQFEELDNPNHENT